MTADTHRPNCANAQNPGCVCAGCGGALHGWQGWVDLAEGSQQNRDSRRRQILGKIERNPRSDALRLNARNRYVSVDLARLDLTDHLSATTGNHQASSLDLAGAPTHSSDKDRLSLVADKILAATWREVSKQIDSYVPGDETARNVKRQLADHAWCGLLIGLVRWIERIDQTAQVLSDAGKQFVERALTERLSGKPAEAVAGIVVDQVWSALAKLVEAHIPLLGEDTLRVLRMLALFTCPSVEQHREVYEHAAKPLMSDGFKLVSDEVKAQVTTLYTAWWRQRSPETAA